MSIGSVSPSFIALDRAVGDHLATRARGDDPLDIAAELILLRGVIDRLELDFARSASRFAATYDECLFLNPSPYSWMRENCNMASGAAVGAVSVGDTADRLERSITALEEGRIGFAHLRLMASTAEAIQQSPTATSLFDEARLLAQAESISLNRFRTECAHVRHAADREAFLAAQVEEHEWSSLRMRTMDGGGLELTGYLDAEGGALVRTALEPLASRRGRDDERCLERRCADALVELCSHSLDTGLVPQRASQRSHVQVTSTLETLLGLVGAPAGEMEHAGVIAGSTVQRLACDATITRVLVDAASAIVDVGRSERVVPGATRRALNVRDRGCRWSGCNRTASWTAAHHVIHWVRGGPTDLDNLVLLCRHHHWLVHEGGWQIALNDHGRLVTMPPRPLARSPDLHMVA
jgi:Domain of unknown function (DUF222)/HNH endonuclease